MKRLISFLLAVLLTVFCLPASAFAGNQKGNDPIILISGFMCSQLYLNLGEENAEKVWGLSTDAVFERRPGAGLSGGEVRAYDPGRPGGVPPPQ